MSQADSAEIGSTPTGRIATLAKSLLPLYAVVFAGFIGYSLMITVFIPMIMSNHDLLLRADAPMGKRVNE